MSDKSQDEAAYAILERVSEICEFLHKNRELAFLGESEDGMRTALAEGLKKCGLDCTRTMADAIIDDGIDQQEHHRIYLIADGAVVIDVRSIDTLDEYHSHQFQLFLNSRKLRLGLIANFSGHLYDPKLITVTNEEGEW